MWPGTIGKRNYGERMVRCGCQGAHIRQMARALGKMPAEEREWAVDYDNPQSATEAYHHMRED